MSKDFLCLQDVDASVIMDLIHRAKFMKSCINSGKKNLDVLKSKTVVTLFYENSTRTRCSFEAAAKYLGANAIDVPVAGSSVKKGEDLIDTAVTLDKMGADAIVIRHSVSGAPYIIAKHTGASVVNAGDGMHAHPTQALLDAYTIYETFGKFEGLKVAIIGDIKHSRVARSNIVCLSKLGAKVTVFGPQTLIPKDIDSMPCTIASSMEDAIKDADVVMGLRIQLERQQQGLFPSAGEYNKFYGINLERMKLAKPNAIVMHPGPVNRGIELSHDVLESEICVKDEQVKNGLATRMALLEMLCLKEK